MRPHTGDYKWGHRGPDEPPHRVRPEDCKYMCTIYLEPKPIPTERLWGVSATLLGRGTQRSRTLHVGYLDAVMEPQIIQFYPNKDK